MSPYQRDVHGVVVGLGFVATLFAVIVFVLVALGFAVFGLSALELTALGLALFALFGDPAGGRENAPGDEWAIAIAILAVVCGTGNDTIRADPLDTVAADCEQVTVVSP